MPGFLKKKEKKKDENKEKKEADEKKEKKKDEKSAPPTPPPQEDTSPVPLIIKRGKLVRLVSYSTIKFLAGVAAVFLIGNIFFSFKLFSSAVDISKRLGVFIEMVSRGDGHILPSLQAIPVLLFLFVDFALMYFVYKLFSPQARPKANKILFILLIVSLSLMGLIFILLIVIISHIYGAHESLETGIIDAMKKYGENSGYKKEIDRLQIEFQCCGSKKYDEWYNITWYDTKLLKNNASDNSQGHTPFSCCSMTSIFPCIHHNIENTGKVYLYTPEQNLSVSTQGCYPRIQLKKLEIGWAIVGNLCLYIMSQGALVISLRFVQTGHFENSKFEGHKRLYTVWLIGCYAGRKSEVTKDSEFVVINGTAPDTVPPELPPVPLELTK